MTTAFKVKIKMSLEKNDTQQLLFFLQIASLRHSVALHEEI